MKIRIALIAAALIACVSARAEAATPKLSGNYIFSFTQTCQANIDLGTSSFVDNGSISYRLGTAAFNNGTGKYTFNGAQAIGSMILGGTGGSNFSKTTGHFSDTFSVSSSTLTLGTQSYGAVYGGVNSSGVATQVNFISVSSSSGGPLNCLNTGTLTHQ